MHTLKILFIYPYPCGEAPSQRFRFEQYYNLLQKNNIENKTSSFYSLRAWKLLYKDGNNLQKTGHILIAFIKRLFLLFRLRQFEFIFIHREVTPVGPPWFEFIASKILKKKIIYDFDDAIWLEDPMEKGSIKSILKCKWKVKYICKWSYKISAGNKFLASYAQKYNENTLIIPTTIDTENYHNPYKTKYLEHINNKKLTIGWTGTHSTLHYLDLLIPVIEKLEKKFDFKFLIISNKPPKFNLKSLEYIPWSKQSEIEDLLRINIGIMPLTDDNWTKGKCGFKALQYMALGIPAVVSPIGVNKNIVKHGVTGYQCKTLDEWEMNLISLLKDKNKRLEMGKETRKFVIENYSLISNSDDFISLFDSE